VKPPLLVVVTGMPGSGKTTLSRAIATDLQLPLVSKDDIKERLYDALGTGDVQWSRCLGRASHMLIFTFAGQVLAAGRPVIAEANFFRGSEEQHFAALPSHRLFQLHCSAPLDVLVSRYAGREDRHPGHHDSERVHELADRLASGVHAPLDLDGDLVEIDTATAVEPAAIAERIRSLL
jgi:predicted kinase